MVNVSNQMTTPLCTQQQMYAAAHCRRLLHSSRNVWCSNKSFVGVSEQLSLHVMVSMDIPATRLLEQVAANCDDMKKMLPEQVQK